MKRRRVLLWSAAVFAGAAVGWIGYTAATWPDVAALARHNPTTSAFIERYQVRQRAAGKPDSVRWKWVPYDRISPNLKRAVLVSEDINFFSHDGFDVDEMKKAVRDAIKEGEPPRGASTLTQQLAKNLWLSPSRNPTRKLEEALLTVQLEHDLSKRRILELYLNVVEFGPGVYGAGAAAETYYGVSAAELSEEQAARLAAALPKPSAWHPGTPSRVARRRTERILRRMAKAQFLWHEI